jgi:hypothetical protein
MFFRPTIEVDDPAALLTLAKDLKPLGGIILFEADKGRYKFMTRQGDDVMAVSYTPTSPYPVCNPRGFVTHGIPLRSPYDNALGWQDILRKLSITSNVEKKCGMIGEGIKKLLGTSRVTLLTRWKSDDDKITNVRIAISNINVTPTITIWYTDVHVRELTSMLEKVGFRVICGKISKE